MKRGTFIAIIAAMCILPVGGCDMDSTGRVELYESAIARIEQESLALDGKIATFQALLAENEQLLSDPNATGDTLAKLREENADLQAKLAAAVPVKALFDQKIGAYRAELEQALADGQIDLEKELTLIGHGVSTGGQTLPPPYNIWAGLIGTALAGVGAVIGSVARGRAAAKEEARLREDTDKRIGDAQGVVYDTRNELENAKAEATAAIRGIVESVDALIQSGSEAVTRTDNTLIELDPDKAKGILARYQAGNCPEAAAAVQRVRKAQGSQVA